MREVEVRVIIPVLDEEQSIAKVLKDIEGVEEIIVVNNGSTDNTVEVATLAGATVLDEPKGGYGKACLKGIGYINQNYPQTDIVVFLDGDYSDYPQDMELLLSKLPNYDMVIGSRTLGERKKGSMTVPQIFGNWLATRLIKMFYKFQYTDLGPFRVIKLPVLNELKMIDENYGWTVEMQIKALKHNFKVTEVPVRYRPRIGQSKVSGTVKGVIMAGYKIIWTIFKYLK